MAIVPPLVVLALALFFTLKRDIVWIVKLWTELFQKRDS